MKKATVINLIKYYSEKNDLAFRTEAYKVADEFDKTGDYQLAEYVMNLLSSPNSFVPQVNTLNLQFLKKIEVNSEPLPLPDEIKADVLGIINATSHGIGVNKFLFKGAPGTGKTETAKHIARILERDLYIVDFAILIDSKLGQTGKNIDELFNEINYKLIPEKTVVLFDEIDALVLDRTDTNDHREMARATSLFLKNLESLNDKIVLIATTNLFKHFDKAILRRFDSIIDFNRYSKEDLMDISEIVLNYYQSKFKNVTKNVRLFKKIMSKMTTLPYPGDLKNLIKTSLAFSNPNDEYDYLKRIYNAVLETEANLKELQKQGFTVREIEILTGISKSQVARELKGE
ncbi:UNVERIFIED_CONTAM: ATP-binding protein [Campylobacter lari]